MTIRLRVMVDDPIESDYLALLYRILSKLSPDFFTWTIIKADNKEENKK